VLRKAVVARLRGVPPLRWRLARVPLDLNHPVWVTDPHVDPESHVHLGRIPAPGGRHELCRLVSELARRPLDLGGPPWEMWLLDGFEGGTTVVAIKMSHALADGGATAELLRKEEPAAKGTIRTLSAPDVPINVPLTPERSFYYETVPLRDAREVRSAFGVYYPLDAGTVSRIERGEVRF
jgi:hypothetical protein